MLKIREPPFTYEKLKNSGARRFLIIKQVIGVFSLQRVTLSAYRTTVQTLVKSFLSIQFKHFPRAQNKHTDALATFALKIDVLDEMIDVTASNLIPVGSLDEQDWHTLLFRIYLIIFLCGRKRIKIFYSDVRGSNRVLACAVSEIRAKEKL